MKFEAIIVNLLVFSMQNLGLANFSLFDVEHVTSQASLDF